MDVEERHDVEASVARREPQRLTNVPRGSGVQKPRVILRRDALALVPAVDDDNLLAEVVG